ncbi:hypothetical protein [Cupriavidus necator]|uniref:hypothetical protein n=1 Tax=Cupriavidus necator TaxID=106590 RepID=UPI00339D6650
MPEGRFRVQRCAVAGVQAVEASSRRTFGRHTHDQYGIGVIVRGGHRSCSGRGMVEAVCGDIITQVGGIGCVLAAMLCLVVVRPMERGGRAHDRREPYRGARG